MEMDSITASVAGLLPYGIAILLGLVLAILPAVALLSERRLNPGIPVAGVALVALSGGLMAQFSIPAELASPEAILGLKQATIIRFAGFMGISAVALGTCTVLAIAGALRGPRDHTSAAMVGGVALLVVVLAVVAGVLVGDQSGSFFFNMRATVYALLAVLVAAASLAGGETGAGRDAGAAASVIFALTVVVSEAAGRAATKFYLILPIGSLQVDKRSEAIDLYLNLVSAEQYWMWAIVCLACLTAVAGVARAARTGEHRAWSALVWLLIVPLIWLLGDPSADAIRQAAAALPPPTP